MPKNIFTLSCLLTSICLCSVLAAPKQHKKAANFQFQYVAPGKEITDLLHNAPKMSFRYLRSVSELPLEVLRACTNYKMAEPGGKWESTDNIMDASLPRQRLVWAVNFRDYYVVHYENGGIGYNCSIVFLEYHKSSGVKVLMTALTWEPVQDYPRFLLRLDEKTLIDVHA